MAKNWFRGVAIILVLLFFDIGHAEAQTRNRPTWFSFNVGHHAYHGDLGNELLSLKVGYDWTLGLSIDQYLGRFLDLKISANYGQLDYNNFFNTSFVNGDLLLQYKPVRTRYPVDPFIGTGIGITSFWDNRSELIENGITLHIPVQVGVDVPLTNSIAATANATYNRTFSDNIDGSNINSRNHDDFVVYSVGIKVSLNRSKDSDKDGIKDRDDLCPDKYGESFWGCPDSDGDGIVDNEDSCPAVAGSSIMNGCPDADLDGVRDSADECPDTKGLYRLKGCPDTANGTDSVSSPEDASPKGRTGNMLTEDLKQKVSTWSKSLQFGMGSSELDSAAFENLDQLANVMQEDPALNLIVRAYTDNSGDAIQNLELSVDRAKAVKDYLVEQGIGADRIFTFGYGESNPIASNDTKEGRIQNRRIELNLYYN